MIELHIDLIRLRARGAGEDGAAVGGAVGKRRFRN